jgi:hypothetical protein
MPGTSNLLIHPGQQDFPMEPMLWLEIDKFQSENFFSL